MSLCLQTMLREQISLYLGKLSSSQHNCWSRNTDIQKLLKVCRQLDISDDDNAIFWHLEGHMLPESYVNS